MTRDQTEAPVSRFPEPCQARMSNPSVKPVCQSGVSDSGVGRRTGVSDQGVGCRSGVSGIECRSGVSEPVSCLASRSWPAPFYCLGDVSGERRRAWSPRYRGEAPVNRHSERWTSPASARRALTRRDGTVIRSATAAGGGVHHGLSPRHTRTLEVREVNRMGIYGCISVYEAA